MKAKDLADKLLQYPEFDVQFSLFDTDGVISDAYLRTFDFMVGNIGCDNKIIRLGAIREL